MEAYQNGDQEKVSEVSKSQIINYLDNEVVKLIRNLNVPGGSRNQNKHVDSFEMDSGSGQVENVEEDNGIC